MELIFGILLGLFVLVVLVVLHELGHALAARRAGVVVEEFGIGFPPRAWSKKLKNGVLFSLNWLPLGGFVKLQGEHDAASKKGDFGAATFWQKTQILLAGVVVNWLIAIVLLTILALVGLPKILPNQFSVPSDTVQTTKPLELAALVKDYPAQKAGLQAGDQIVSVDGEPIDSAQEFITLTASKRGETVAFVYVRDGQQATKNIQLRDAEAGVFGSGLRQETTIRATWSAPIVGVATTAQFTWATLQGLGTLAGNFFGGLAMQLSPDQSAREKGGENIALAGNSVAGPVGLLGTIFPAAGQGGITTILFLAAVISLSLAVMNTLPIPALDGGSWFLVALFRVLKKPLTRDLEEKIKGTGFLVLMGLFLLVTVADVFKLF